MFRIKSLFAKMILNSRGEETIEAELKTEFGVFQSSVPSGASKGKYEVVEIKSDLAIKNINEIIVPKLKIKRKLTSEQKKVDRFLIGLDKTKNKSKLGANAILAISMVCCRAGAAAKNISLYQYIAKIFPLKNPCTLPSPCFNIINGGAHAKNNLDIQEFMIVPQMSSFRENLMVGKKVYQVLGEILKEKFHGEELIMGDETGFAPNLKNTKQALDLLMQAIEKAGYQGKVKIGLDCAASQFYKNNKYFFEGQELNGKELSSFYLEIIKTYPILFLEDPFDENDFVSWQAFQPSKDFLIIGDDLTTTNPMRIKQAKRKKHCNGIVIKPTQIGTVTETLKSAKIAKKFGWKIMVSHRSGETEDDFIADLSVGINADFIKSGAPASIERMTKYNRLLEIEKMINSNKNRYKLVLLRHGESVWNRDNRFTGWTDVDLTEKGTKEAIESGKLLKKEGFVFDIAFTSVLKKAIKTMDLTLREMGLTDIQKEKSWRLNERHYGNLQGLNKSEVAKKYGEKQVFKWRRSYSVRPPALQETDPRYPGKDILYKNLKKEDIPLTESLRDTEMRLLPYWEEKISLIIKSGKKVLIVAHGNSLRALVKYLDNVSPKKIPKLNIPTGVPLIYELDENLNPLRHYYLEGKGNGGLPFSKK